MNGLVKMGFFKGFGVNSGFVQLFEIAAQKVLKQILHTINIGTVQFQRTANDCSRFDTLIKFATLMEINLKYSYKEDICYSPHITTTPRVTIHMKVGKFAIEIEGNNPVTMKEEGARSILVQMAEEINEIYKKAIHYVEFKNTEKILRESFVCPHKQSPILERILEEGAGETRTESNGTRDAVRACENRAPQKIQVITSEPIPVNLHTAAKDRHYDGYGSGIDCVDPLNVYSEPIPQTSAG